jgi:hypothetical protein
MTAVSTFESDIDLKSPEMLYLFLDRGVSNSLDNNLLFFAEPGNINIETKLDSFMELKSQDQKIKNYMRSIRKLTSF